MRNSKHPFFRFSPLIFMPVRYSLGREHPFGVPKGRRGVWLNGSYLFCEIYDSLCAKNYVPNKNNYVPCRKK